MHLGCCGAGALQSPYPEEKGKAYFVDVVIK